MPDNELTKHLEYTRQLTTIVTRNGKKMSRFVSDALDNGKLADWFTALSPEQREDLLSQEISGTDPLIIQLAQRAPQYLEAATTDIAPENKFGLWKIQSKIDGWTPIMVLASYHPEYLHNTLAGISPKNPFDLLKIQNKDGWTAAMLLPRDHPEHLKSVLETLNVTNQIHLLLGIVNRHNRCTYDDFLRRTQSMTTRLRGTLTDAKENALAPVVDALIDPDTTLNIDEDQATIALFNSHPTFRKDVVSYLIKYQGIYRRRANHILDQEACVLASVLPTEDYRRLRKVFDRSTASASNWTIRRRPRVGNAVTREVAARFRAGLIRAITRNRGTYLLVDDHPADGTIDDSDDFDAINDMEYSDLESVASSADDANSDADTSSDDEASDVESIASSTDDGAESVTSTDTSSSDDDEDERRVPEAVLVDLNF